MDSATAAAFMQLAPDAMLFVGSDGAIVSANALAEKLFGYQGGELAGVHIDRLVPERFRERHSAQCADYRAHARPRPMGTGRNFFALRKDGTEFPADISLGPVEGGVLCSIRDITERLRVEQRLIEAQEIARVGSWEWTAANGTITTSKEFRRICQVEGDSLRDFLDRVHPEDRDNLSRALDRALREGVPFDFDHRIVLPDGERLVRSSGKVECDEGGHVLGVLGTCQDITELRKVEQELSRRAEDLARSNSELEQFAHVASHDLQEPLRKIAGFVEVLSKRYRGRLDEKADEYIQFVVDSTVRMQRQIHDLLQYSQIGRSDSRFEMLATEEVLAAVRKQMEPAISESKAVLTSDPLPVVWGDKLQLLRLFQNLISNALKFRGPEAPRIHVGVRSAGRMWEFAVTDHGIGIDPAHFGKLFRMFGRLHPYTKYPGTGVGLAACKKVVELHGGRISVSSEPGQGATFTFTLPRERSRS